jgi:hypothetical protein
MLGLPDGICFSAYNWESGVSAGILLKALSNHVQGAERSLILLCRINSPHHRWLLIVKPSRGPSSPSTFPMLQIISTFRTWCEADASHGGTRTFFFFMVLIN